MPSNQSVIDCLRRPRVRIKFLPARFKFAQLFALTVDLARDQSRIPPGRSIRLTSSPVNGAYLGAPRPKIGPEFVERIGLLRLRRFG